MFEFMSIGLGATLGAWLRWWFGMTLNHIFPTMPLGTLTANILESGCFAFFRSALYNLHAPLKKQTS